MKLTKQAKGLKGLSENVYEIVKQEGVTSYSKVATILIQQMKENSKIYGHIFDRRDEQNIKRRVYDALNVLISA
jgi:predicted CopG family antitoxin